MARLFLIALLILLISGPAFAEWVEVGSTNEGKITIYVDQGTIRRKGDRVKIWELYDFQTMQTADDISYLSSKMQSEYDCTEERSRIITFSHHSGHMGDGRVVYTESDESKWTPAAPESVAQGMLKLACATKK